jgi:hypothetical protein
MSWTTEESGFDIRQGQEISLFSIMSRPALRLIHLISYLTGTRDCFARGKAAEV